MKAILVIDMPNDCTECPLLQDHQCSPLGEMQNFVDIGRNGRCPLRPLPQKNKYDVEKYATVDYENNVTLGHYLNKGWNACLEELEK